MVEEKGLAEVKSKVCVVHIEVRCVCQIKFNISHVRQISTMISTVLYGSRGRLVISRIALYFSCKAVKYDPPVSGIR